METDDVVWSGTWVAERLGVELVADGEGQRADGRSTDARGTGGQSSDGLSTGGQSTDGLHDLLGLALRRNPKRAHLLVSNVLGKHVPQLPSRVYGAGFALGEDVRKLLGDEAAACAVVLGYAETATGLGHAVADGVGVAPYLHSTRRPVDGVAKTGGFEESHSHATSHLLLPEDPGLLAGAGPLVLVDDEFSTGNTVLNTIRDLHERYPREWYVIVALVDMRSARDRGRLTEFAREIGARVDLIAMASGTVRLPQDVLEKGQALVARYDPTPNPPAPEGTPSEASTDAATAPEATGAADSGQAAHGPSATPSRIRSSHAAPGAAPVRVELGWPCGVPDGGRHGFVPAHRGALEAALPGMAERIAGALPEGARRVLVLGFEELMYAPLRLATALEERVDAEVRYSTTTRSPVLAVDDPGYAIRTRIVFPAHDNPADGPGTRYAYNVAGAGFDAVVAVVDSAADTPELHAPDGLLARLAAHTGHVVLAVVPSYIPGAPPIPGTPEQAPQRQEPPMPEPLRGPAFSSYAPEDVGWLLQDLSDVELEAPTEEREEAIQSGGAHYAESLPVEYQPTAQYQQLFKAALDTSAARIAKAVATVTETVLAERSPHPVLVSLARAGTPVGVLMRRYAQHRHGLDLPHYAVSIVRGRGIDETALRWLAAHHDPADVVFVDGWTGKGAITRELAQALDSFAATTGIHGFDPEIAVLADPGGCVRTYGTREDFLIPSACLNSTVSGLISRTVLRSDLVGPDDFHGAKFYRELAADDVSGLFLDTVAARFDEVADAVDAEVKELLSADRAPTWEGWAAVERISEEYGIHDVNLVKPGVGETTRVLLRRVPWKILAKRDAGADLDHVRLLAEQRGVPVEEVDGLPYTCVGLIHPKYTRGATGADGKAVAAK
ncbi:phosphoribosyltransferase [Streptomyces sp. ISL-99]|uniref:phosphoribosyltransferase n=1 Tax=Streptomyces sp. ISL-99 TaxID=2819193 RepID=UPI001BEBF6C4|nr:phosphoribosyltransferase [Streptomyces sp. ISL-99]MBT2525525.1 phosphoribosyltransferase [Streptomyces sp. ISL-99]